ncbi:MAG: acireductone synthase [Pirellulaceae bacterium]
MEHPIQAILLDIEGTTSSISFVHDEMFPFVLERLSNFLDQSFDAPTVQAAAEQIAIDAGYSSLNNWSSKLGQEPRTLVQAEVRRLMSDDAKATGLKALQGVIWKDGFESGQLEAHIYADVIPKIRDWNSQGIDVRIYSSGSIAAQKLFFGHLAGEGDCLSLFSGHYDTTSGGKKEMQSYLNIAEDWKIAPQRILFVSDIPEELAAAEEAGFRVLLSIRAGNKPVGQTCSFNRIQSFEEIALNIAGD